MLLPAVVFVAACGGDGSTPVDPALGVMTEHLCLASRSDAARPLIAHFDQAHGGLHVLAEQVAEVDRGVSASLLEAKQVFEAAVAQSSDVDRLQAALEPLLASTDEALARLGDDAPRLECA